MLSQIKSEVQVIKVAARASRLSRAQVDEVYAELKLQHPQILFHTIFIETTGDRDLTTSLRLKDKTDFFTKEIDALQLAGECRIAIHSAKDLPDPLAKGLCIVALTDGVDGSDALVFRDGENLQSLRACARVGTSSVRREKAIKALRPDLVCVDVRGSIDQRLLLLDTGQLDALVIAEAALLRLQLKHRSRTLLVCQTAALQGKLAVLARDNDREMRELFASIDSR